MITNENLQHFKNVAVSLAKEIYEFENQQAAQVDDWPMAVDDLPKDGSKPLWSIANETQRAQDVHFDKYADSRSANAFAQLSRLIRHVNKGWEPDFTNHSQNKFTVVFNGADIYIDEIWAYSFLPKCLHFKNKSDAERSIETWRQLWLDYFQADEQ